MKEIMLPILSLIVGIISAVITARLSLRKIYTEKWWDRKEKAYSEIIEALYEIMQYLAAREQESEGRIFSDEKMKELEDKYSEAYWKLKKAMDIGGFIISSEAAIVLNDLKNRPKLSWRNNAPWDVYYEEYRYHKEALEHIITIAKNDLKSHRY